jgi:hypothetical protein
MLYINSFDIVAIYLKTLRILLRDMKISERPNELEFLFPTYTKL